MVQLNASIWRFCLFSLPVVSSLTVPQQTLQEDSNDLVSQHANANDADFNVTDISTQNDWEITEWDYDVIIVGGGPGGLAAMNSLGRVRRKTLLYDSKEYRNDKTRYMHDVLGNDGTRPIDFRSKVRGDINGFYGDTSFFEMQGKKVVSIFPLVGGFQVTDNKGAKNTAKRVILATGIKDVVPNKPGFQEAWGRGMFWCPWCDGYDYKNKKIAIVGRLDQAIGATLTIRKLTQNVVIITGGALSADDKKKAEEKYPQWEKVLKSYGVTVYERDLTKVERLDNNEMDPKNDNFRLTLTSGTVEANGIITHFGTDQTSHLPKQLHLTMTDDKKIQVASNMETTTKGIFAIGDANSDGSTNAYHAMWSGKRAAVSVHVALSREEYKESIPTVMGADEGMAVEDMDEEATMRAIEDMERQMGNEVEMAWQMYGG